MASEKAGCPKVGSWQLRRRKDQRQEKILELEERKTAKDQRLQDALELEASSIRWWLFTKIHWYDDNDVPHCLDEYQINIHVLDFYRKSRIKQINQSPPRMAYRPTARMTTMRNFRQQSRRPS